MEDEAGNRLVQIQVIHRHGARSPAYTKHFPSICGAAAFRTFLSFVPRLPADVELFPTDKKPISLTEAASCYHGQLTPVGAAQMFALGARLRARYATLLPDVFDPSLIAVRSTAMHRTVESAVATLSGMFPAVGVGEAARPVDIEVRPRIIENMIAFRSKCNRLFDLQQAAHASFAFPQGLEQAASKYLPHSALKAGSLCTIALRDIAVALRDNGLEPEVWEPQADRLAIAQILRVYLRESWGLGSGLFVDELLHEAASHETNQWTCKLYSSHDTTILPMMGCFEDKAERGVPEFATDVVLETWKSPSNDEEPKLRLKYSGKDVVISGCEKYGPLCPLSVVRQAVSKHIPTDYERACGGSRESRKASGELPTDAKKASASEGTSF